jgi:FtsP/CotA-like multicopper oxidase with cupredoxin domain
MRFNFLKSSLKTAVLATTILLLGAGLAVAQSVSLTAAPTTLITPDGATVQMWGYTCGAVAAPATCTKLNPAAAAGTWSPIVITVPPGALAISLTNGLPAGVPTSLTLVGQLGGGLGTPTKVPSPVHPVQTLTWPASGADATNTPPSQEDRVQSFGMQVAPGATTALPSWASLRPGTYLLESGTHPSIQGPMGLYGILVVTDSTNKIAYPAAGTTPAVTYGADLPLLLSEIDPVQNAAVATAVTLAGFSETKVWSGQPGGCANPATANSGNCYPPAVNYSPRYYLINGVAFNKTSPATSLFAASPATGVTGNVLVRIVNAGLRMHVPSVVGSLTGTPAAPGLGLIAEDGNRLPGVTRVQNEVFMAAGKTYDVSINVPAGTALPIYDRELSLSGNATARDAGMLAYISVNGSGLPTGAAAVTATANPDSYPAVITGQTLTVSDPSKGLLANDVNVYGARTLAPVAGLTLNADGTFSYTGAATSFT